MTGSPSTTSPAIHLHLRGGARRKRRPLGDDEQLPGLLWFFAGGMGPPPTGKQLREMNKRRREIERRRLEAKQARGGGLFSKLKGILTGSTGGSGSSKSGGTKTTSTSASGTDATSKSETAASGAAANATATATAA